MNIVSRLAGAIAAIVLTCSLAAAQSYPDRPIKLVVPFAPGGGVDSLARIIAHKLQEQMKQTVIVENRAGAGGNLGTDFVAKSAPDGYTMLLTTNGHAISPAIYKKLSFDALADFEPITQVVGTTLLLIANKDFAATNLQELLALARAKPGGLDYGSTGVGNALHLTMEMLKSAANVDIQMVPFRGDAPLNQAVIQGSVQMSISPLWMGRSQVEAGNVRAIAVTTLQRSKAMPNVPTIAEQGFPGFDSGGWQGLFFPAKTPAPIVQRIQKEVAVMLEDPNVLKQVASFGGEPVGSEPAAFQDFVKREIDKFKKIVSDAKVPLQD